VWRQRHARSATRSFVAHRARLVAVLRTLGIVSLVLLILFLAIPLGIAMVMGPCPECPSAGMAPMSICFAILAGFLVLPIFGTSALTRSKLRQRILLLARSLERPPRFA
jgi:hypothetical protein